MKYENGEHHVTVLPQWLSTIALNPKFNLSDVLDYGKLSSTLSKEDVAFYHVYLLHLSSYVPDYFNDMCSIANMPTNVSWAEQHSALVQSACDQFEVMFNKHSDDLTGEDVPTLVKKSELRPIAVGHNALVLVSNFAKTQTKDEFCSDCIEALFSQLSHEKARQTLVFKEFAQSIV